MEVRHGTCADCGAKYKVPATFKADKARCKACGGVVAIGPVESAEPAPKPQQAAPPAVPAAKPAAPKRTAPKTAPGPVAKPVSSAPPRRAARPVRPAAAKTAAAEPAAAEESADKPAIRTRAGARGGAKAGARGGAKSGSRRSGSRAGRAARGADDEEESGTRAGRRRAPAKKKSPVPMVAAAVVVIGAAAGGFFMLKGGDEGVVVAGDGTTAEAPAVEPETTDDATLEDVTNGVEDADETGLDDVTDEVADETPVKKPEKPAADPSSVDLTALEVFGPAPESTDEEWAQYEEWVADVIDPDAGLRGSRAEKSLLEAGRAAYPAIVNGMRGLNYASTPHMRAGDRCQTALTKILNGINWGWKYDDPPTPDSELFNKKVVTLFHGQWVKSENDLEYWIKFAKLDDEQAAALRAELGDKVSSSTPDVDDEELFDIDD